MLILVIVVVMVAMIMMLTVVMRVVSSVGLSIHSHTSHSYTSTRLQRE